MGGHAFGSTKSGIAPFYSDKYAKYGIQVCELFDEKRLMERLEQVCQIKNVLFEHLYHKPLLDPKALFQQLMGYREQIAPYVGNALTFVKGALADGKKVLLEAQLGAMKDPDFGMVQGATEVALTAVDVLGYLDEIKVCTGYEIDGKVTRDFPVTRLLEQAKPVYTTLPGWKCDIRGEIDYAKLPQAAKNYVDFLEGEIGVPITLVSTGPKRHEIARR